MCNTCMPNVPKRLEGVRPPETEVMDGDELPCRCWELKPCPSQDQQVLINPIAISPASSHPLCFSDTVTLAGLELTEVCLPRPLGVEVLGFKSIQWLGSDDACFYSHYAGSRNRQISNFETSLVYRATVPGQLGASGEKLVGDRSENCAVILQ